MASSSSLTPERATAPAVSQQIAAVSSSRAPIASDALGSTPGTARPAAAALAKSPAVNPSTGTVAAVVTSDRKKVAIKPTRERSIDKRNEMRAFLTARRLTPFRDEDHDGKDDSEDELPPPALGVFDGQAEPPQVMTRPTEGTLKAAGSFDGDLRDLPQQPIRRRERPEREVENALTPMPGTVGRTVDVAPPSSAPAAPAPAPIVSFDGMDFVTNGMGHPPDTNGDVGPNHVIESVNTSLAIYAKTGGAPIASFPFDTFMSQGNFGNLCDTDNFGDPVVLYDTFEDRWIVTDFAFKLSGNDVVFPPGMFQCFAVSKTPDPVAGGWNFYSFNTTGGLGDYGKFGIWPDGLYMTFNMFDYAASGGFQNSRVYVMNKAQMYANAPSVQLVSFNMTGGVSSLLPSNARLQTGTPPAGRPNYLTAVVFTNSLSVWKFHVDWTRLALSTVTGPFESTTIALTEYTGGLVDTPGADVDSLYPRLMMQNQYSNIGGIESLWNSHTAGTTGNAAIPGARWYQVKVTGDTVEANATQSATYGADTTQRWMSSVAVNKNGDMALGFNVADGVSLHPGLSYVARLAGDAVNTITMTDRSLVVGGGSPTSITRWGDYSAMTLDPNGCTFWFIGEYYAVSGSNWKTRIGSFNLGGCTNDTTGSINGVVRNLANTPLPGVVIQLGVRSTTTNASGAYSFAGLPDGTYPTITARQSGYNPVTFTNITVPGGGSVVQDFQLTKPATSGCFIDTAQADFQTDVAAVNCDVTTSPGSVKLPSAPSIEQNTAGTTTGTGFGTPAWTGQTFIPSFTGAASQAEIQLFCSGCGATPPNLTLSIRATSGGLPTGADLASATVPGSTFAAGTIASYTATFGAPPTLTGGTQYALILRPVSAPAGSGYFWIRASPSSYANGQRVLSPDSGGSWSADSTRDYNFKVYGPGSTFISPGTFTSSIKDANPAVGGTVTWSTISFATSEPAGTTLKFRVAGSNSPNGPFTYVGPGGTGAAGDFYTSGTSLSRFNGFRYLRYQVEMTSTGAATPIINDVTICFVTTPRPLLDLNADGTGDVFTYSSGTGAWKRAVANGAGGFTEANGSWDPNWTVTPAKFNQDAYTDMFLFNTSSGQWFRMLNDGANGWTTQAFGTWWPNWQRFVMDLNGDGISDIFLYDSGTGVWFKANLTNPAGDFTYSQGGWNPSWEITPMTLNGDAYADMFLMNRSTGRWFWVLGQAGASFTYPASEVWFTGWNFYPGDFNGDGLTDLLLHVSGGNYFVAMNNGLGNGFTYTGGAWSANWTPYVGDWDADGDSDLLLWAKDTTGQWFQMMSNGLGAFSVGGSQTWSLGWNLYVTDLNTDGRSDIVLYHPTSGVWYQARNFTLGTFTYSSGSWASNLTIIVRSPFF
jgi:hypothetical protein